MLRAKFPTGRSKVGLTRLPAVVNDCYLRTTAIDHRQTMAAFPTICRARATCSALDFASLPDPSIESPRGRRECFRQADGKPELMIDRAHGGASPEQQ
jgi:hypothetical protein